MSQLQLIFMPSAEANGLTKLDGTYLEFLQYNNYKDYIHEHLRELSHTNVSNTFLKIIANHSYHMKTQ